MGECTCYEGVNRMVGSLDIEGEMNWAYVMIAAISARCERHIGEISRSIVDDETGTEAALLFTVMETHGCKISRMLAIHDDWCLNSVIDDTMAEYDPVIGQMIREVETGANGDERAERFAEFMRDGLTTRLRYVAAAIAGWAAAWQAVREIMSGRIANVVMRDGPAEPDFDACHCAEIIDNNFAEDDRNGPQRSAYVMAAAMIAECVLHVEGVADVLIEDETGSLMATMWQVISGHMVARDDQLAKLMGDGSGTKYTDLFATLALAARDSGVMRRFDVYMGSSDAEGVAGFFAGIDAHDRERFLSIVNECVQYVERAHALLSDAIGE